MIVLKIIGYFKDKNTNNIEIVSEAAETVHLIYDSYLGGMGVKAIAQMLTKSQRKTPAQMQKELDELITAELLQTKEQYARLWESVETSIDSWIPDTSDTAEQVKKLRKRILDLEEELEAILMERIRDRANAERYDRMISSLTAS